MGGDVLGTYVALGIFFATQIATLIWVLATQKGDMKMIKAQLTGITMELSKLGNVLVELAKTDGRLNLMEERMSLQGKRLDRTETRLTQHIEVWLKKEPQRSSSRSSDQAPEP